MSCTLYYILYYTYTTYCSIINGAHFTYSCADATQQNNQSATPEGTTKTISVRAKREGWKSFVCVHTLKYARFAKGIGTDVRCDDEQGTNEATMHRMYAARYAVQMRAQCVMNLLKSHRSNAKKQHTYTLTTSCHPSHSPSFHVTHSQRLGVQNSI